MKNKILSVILASMSVCKFLRLTAHFFFRESEKRNCLLYSVSWCFLWLRRIYLLLPGNLGGETNIAI